MKFTINKIILWFKGSNKTREFEFKPNKINIITGDNNTGKTAILEIIDYCLLSEKVDIPLEVINENIEWYGLNFTIDKNTFTIARGQLSDVGQVSQSIFFAPKGNIPELPEPNSNKAGIITVLNDKFNIEFKELPLTGRRAKKAKNVSYRHFLLFNILSDNILTDKKKYFPFSRFADNKIEDHFNIAFDLAVGAEDPNAVIIKNRLKYIENQLSILEGYQKEYTSKIYSIGKTAKSFGLIDKNIEGVQENYVAVKSLMQQFSREKLSSDLSKLSSLQNDEYIISRDIRRLKKYKSEYEKYKSFQNDDYDSLKPIEYIYENYKEIIKTPNILSFIDNLEQEFISIKKDIKEMPISEINIDGDIEHLEYQLKEIQLEIEQFPIKNLDFESEAGKFIYVGQIKERFVETEKYKKEKQFERKITEFIEEQKKLLPFVNDKSVNIDTIIKDISELIQKYIDNTNALEEYSEYKAKFDYENKSLIYTKSKLNKDYSGLGGSSNYLFLQLAFTLGLHEYFILPKDIKDIPHIANFLIIDQFSQPFNEETNLSLFQQETKLKKALELLDGFIDYLNLRLNNDFQFILLDNSQPETIKRIRLKNIHFVTHFPDKNNALIPKHQIDLTNKINNND